MPRGFLGLGSNVGDRLAHLRLGLAHLHGEGVEVTGVSGVWETEPVGGPDQGPFLNLVAEVETDLEPRALLARAQQAEVAEGRVRHERWGPRTLDVDIIHIEGVTVDEPDLQVPHPRMWQRRFVLAPLRELAPGLVPEASVKAAEGEVERLGDLDEVADGGQ